MLKELGALIITAVIFIVLAFAAPALIAAAFYYGVPYTTGYDGMGFWQYFVSVFLVIILSHVVFSALLRDKGGAR